MKKETIKCPACLKNSGYTTETDFNESDFDSIYETRFATKDTNGYINEGFEAVCDKCGYEFYIYGYVPEPEIKIQSTIDGRAFLEARNIKWPSFIKNDYDLRIFENALSELVYNGYDKAYKKLFKWGKDYTKALKFLKDKVKPVKIEKEKDENEGDYIELHNEIEKIKENRDKNIFDMRNFLREATVPWYKRILNKK